MCRSTMSPCAAIVSRRPLVPLSFLVGVAYSVTEVATLASPPVHEAYGRLPVSFEENRGQTDPQVEFLSRGRGYTVFLTKGGEAVVALSTADSSTQAPGDPAAPTASGAVVRLKLVDARATASAVGRDPLPGKVNYLTGQDAKRWRTGIATYRKAAYEDVYPGIDLVYHGDQGQLEYDFIVEPGADPDVIALHVDGADWLQIDDAGDLVVHIGDRQMRQQKPVVYQQIGGARTEIAGEYVLLESGQVKFGLGKYDESVPLVIDPVLVYSTYLGGAFSRGAPDSGVDIAIDAAGNTYVAGNTRARDFPTTAGAYDSSYSSGVFNTSEVFVAKLDSAGSTLVYSTFLGGSGVDGVTGLEVDANGNAYVAGSTESADFPTTAGAYDTSWNGDADGFVAKLAAGGGALLYSTFLGNDGFEGAAELVVDDGGNAYIVGFTTSTGFPTTVGAYDTTHNGGQDAFVTKLNPTASTLVYSTFLGGSVFDSGRGLAVDVAGNTYVTGDTRSSDFPTTPGAYDTSWNNSGDAFVAKLNATGTALVYSTFLGGSPVAERGSGSDVGLGIGIDAAGNAYVAGTTNAANFPTTPGGSGWIGPPNQTHAFVTKVDAAGSALIYSTYLGGGQPLGTTAEAVVVDVEGNAYVTGRTGFALPSTPGAYDTTFNLGAPDAFVAKLGPMGPPWIYATFLGGSGQEQDIGSGLAIDAAGKAYVTGQACSTGFPTTAGAYDSSADGCDAFVTVLDPAGAALVYSTYLGGGFQPGGGQFGNALAVDGTGNVYVTGSTTSADFPTSAGAYDTTQNAMDVFVTKLDQTGSTLVYSTFLGGGDGDGGRGVAVDASGQAYVTGETSSGDFPTTAGAYDTTHNGSVDVFVSKLSTTGDGLAYSTLIGGNGFDSSGGIAIDASGNAYVTGSTNSTNGFPTTAGAFDTSRNGLNDAFVTKIDATGAALSYSTFLGGTGSEEYGRGVAVDSTGHAYVAGSTDAPDFPTTATAYDSTYNLKGDAFLTKVDPTGTGLWYSTFLGGGSGDSALGVAIDESGNAYVTGTTTSTDFPTTAGAFDLSPNGGPVDAFVTKLDAAGGNLAYSTFVGGSGHDQGNAVAVDASGSAWVTGLTFSTDFPTTPGAVDSSANDFSDAFVTKLDATGAALAYSTYLGPGVVQDVAVGVGGTVYVTGSTSSNDFPTTLGAYDRSRNGTGSNVFITKIGVCGDVRGIGSIGAQRGWALFGLDVTEDAAGTGGPVVYLDPSSRRWLRSTAITSLVISGPQATIIGQGQDNTRAVVSFRVDVLDGDADTFSIDWPGYAASGSLTFGDIAVGHECN